MIRYQRGGIHFLLKVFQLQGSVFPFACMVALPAACWAAALKELTDRGIIDLPEEDITFLKNNAAWNSFSVLVGFLVIFRTSQAYNRFWDGATSTHQMRAEWFDACSSAMAFCKYSTSASEEDLLVFQHTLARLFSMLHAVALADIEDCSSTDIQDVMAFRLDLLDAEGIDEQSLRTIRDCSAKVELVFQWIQQLIVEVLREGVLTVPPPLISRTFQEIANGMVQFHEAIKISTIPFPFPYAQACDCLLIIHWLVVPFVISQWVTRPWWAAIFTFIQVLILWSLNSIAIEIENPFGMDDNDLDAKHMQLEMNRHLLLLLDPNTKRTAKLSLKAKVNELPDWEEQLMESTCSFSTIWKSLDEAQACPREKRTSTASASSAMVGGTVGLTVRSARASIRSQRQSASQVVWSDGPCGQASASGQADGPHGLHPGEGPVAALQPSLGDAKPCPPALNGDCTRSNDDQI
mmetsp:Transcript_71698/g.222349  ORF Transcript_71698/g.222349 Transcript_71698/m.222349 type:complete len:464 (+) Transcript_71698:160-1551(+)